MNRRETVTDAWRLALYVGLVVAFLVGAAGGYVTAALLGDAESVSVTFRTGSVAVAVLAPAVAVRYGGHT